MHLVGSGLIVSCAMQLSIAEAARAKGIFSYVVVDAGRTQVCRLMSVHMTAHH